MNRLDLVGMAEIAERVGVDTYTPGKWLSRGLFTVEPIYPSINGDPAYDWIDVVRWLIANKRKHFVQRWLDSLGTEGEQAGIAHLIVGKIEGELQRVRSSQDTFAPGFHGGEEGETRCNACGEWAPDQDRQACPNHNQGV